MSRRSSPRPLLLLTAGCALILGLTGCTPPGDLEARLTVDGSVEVVICHAIEVHEIGFWVRVPGDEPSPDVWVAQGSTTAEAGTVFSYGVAPDGMETVSGPEDLPSDGILGAHVKPAEDSDAQSSNGTFDIEKLSTDAWLGDDGRSHSQPCD
jgi:hypothetical protein